VCAGALAASLLAVRPASVQACSPGRPDVALVRPPWPESSGLLLVSESLELDCDDPNHCRWRSVHTYTRAEPGEPARVPMQLPFSKYDSLSVRWGGEAVELLGEEQRQAAIDWVAAHEGERDEAPNEGVWLFVEDDGQQLQVELEIAGEVYGEGRNWNRVCRYTALEVRHPFVPRDARGVSWRWWSRGPAAVAPEARTRVHVETDPGLLLEVGRARRNTARRPADLDEPTNSGVELAVLERQRISGGPFIALGGAILDANPARGRIGWEHAHPYPFLFYSGALETDFTHELTLVPAVEITHGGGIMAFAIPRAGFGVGLPVQILPDPRPGLRAQVSFSWIVFSILTTFDWLMPLPPTQSGVERPHMFKLAFLGQFSF
jgi:hypothetical protein